MSGHQSWHYRPLAGSSIIDPERHFMANPLLLFYGHLKVLG
jgi:hypothetical protein